MTLPRDWINHSDILVDSCVGVCFSSLWQKSNFQFDVKKKIKALCKTLCLTPEGTLFEKNMHDFSPGIKRSLSQLREFSLGDTDFTWHLLIFFLENLNQSDSVRWVCSYQDTQYTVQTYKIEEIWFSPSGSTAFCFSNFRNRKWILYCDSVTTPYEWLYSSFSLSLISPFTSWLTLAFDLKERTKDRATFWVTSERQPSSLCQDSEMNSVTVWIFCADGKLSVKPPTFWLPLPLVLQFC